MRAARLARAAALLLVPTLLVGLGLLARAVGGAALRDFTRYETPFRVPPVGVPAGPGLARQVVVVLVDGLGQKASQGLPFLDELRAKGADFDCVVGEPSLSLPGRAVLFSGAWAEVNGQLSNYNPRPLRVDHLFAAAREQGRLTGLAAGGNGALLFAPFVDRVVAYGEDAETAPLAAYEASLRDHAARSGALLDEVRGEPGLVVVELHLVDKAGHGWGARSDEYRRAALRADDATRGLASRLDLTRDALVVTADHGHVAAGGHGGPEEDVLHVPLMLAGAGVRPGARGTARQVDVASTLSALLGLPVPGSNQGRPLLDALALDPAGRVEVLRAVVAQRERFVENYAYRVATLDEPKSRSRMIEPEEVAAPEGAGEGWYVARLGALDAREAQVKAARTMLEAEARSRPALVLMFGPLLVAAALAAARVVSVRHLGRAALAGVAGAALYHAALPAAGLAYSFTAVNKDEQLPAFFARDMALGLSACALAVFVAAWRERRASGARLLELTGTAWLVTAAFCQVLLVKLSAVFWAQGASVTWRLGDMYWAFGFYLDLLAVMAVGLCSPLMVLPAWLAALRPVSSSAPEAAPARGVVAR
ncbi:MAG TPA: alkaline phosphatase family protein [Vicinamibacteria bacterium]|nr:alkaline phosphatase family protein [Vicinamibacteria bacterium]